jgi:hypothetical protein
MPCRSASSLYRLCKKGTVQPDLVRKFSRVFEFSPWNTGEVETQVVDFLKSQRLKEENQQAVGALVAIGLGLLLLLALAEK